MRIRRALKVVCTLAALAACATTPTAKPGTRPQGPATAEEARAFYTQVDADLRRLWIARDKAAWVSENFITDDTEALAAAGEEETAAYLGQKIPEATRFDGLDLPPDLARMRTLLKIAQTVPAPADAARRRELAEIEVHLTGLYGKGKYCPAAKPGTCYTLGELEKVIATSRDPAALADAWAGWHTISLPMKPLYERYVQLANEGAAQLGFADVGALWRSGYDMTPEAFEADEERMWQQVKPLYDQLHCYVRKRLRQKYGDTLVPAHGPIPAHLLGNMWAQEWNNVYDLVEPYPGQQSLDVSAKIAEKKLTPEQMVKLGEKFFVSLGFQPLPQTFWERSLFTKPRDREVVCHASAWDPSYANDLRIKMCIEPTEEDLITIHHELGHDFYFQSYYTKPTLFQQGANDGFHEAIGDTIAFSVTPAYLKSVGLLDSVPSNHKALVNQQMKMAISKVAFLPFGFLVDKWRWDVFSGKTTPAQYNEAWWKLREKYQGVSAPAARPEGAFDPGAKFHVPASTPYARYFLSFVYQFQFHRALCKAAGWKGPLDQCSIYGNAAAGEKLRAMLSLGSSKPWPEAMAVLDGETRGDATAMLEYFAPLRGFLEEQTRGEQCGW